MTFWLPFMVMALPASLALIKNILFWKLARRKLTQGFRDLAVRAMIPVQAAAGPPLIALRP